MAFTLINHPHISDLLLTQAGMACTLINLLNLTAEARSCYRILLSKSIKREMDFQLKGDSTKSTFVCVHECEVVQKPPLTTTCACQEIIG